ncbi:hypothetical protein EYF80_017880 [Liparis tanakae]|uniref:Uncharacterized protein n=1 Tax=Liparis tanakae TaxID=230148 RepID=A0A4Z2I3Q9_9TELE|nr:hypothetical protein EYF80_017880 [Liparis tanakae]
MQDTNIETGRDGKKDRSKKSKTQEERGKGGKGGNGDIYTRPLSSSGSCHGDRARASEHSRFGGSGRGWTLGGVSPLPHARYCQGVKKIEASASPGCHLIPCRCGFVYPVNASQESKVKVPLTRGVCPWLIERNVADTTISVEWLMLQALNRNALCFRIDISEWMTCGLLRSLSQFVGRTKTSYGRQRPKTDQVVLPQIKDLNVEVKSKRSKDSIIFDPSSSLLRHGTRKDMFARAAKQSDPIHV